jgi:hypothetical protein
MLETVVDSDYPNCLAIVSLDIAAKPQHFMNLWGVSSTGIPVSRYTTSKPSVEMHWLNAMNAPCRDPNR